MPKAREAQAEYVATSRPPRKPAPKPRRKSSTPTRPKPQFVVDSRGKKTAVILPIEEYEELMEDLHDLAIILERRDEAGIPLEELEEQLIKDGILPGRD